MTEVLAPPIQHICGAVQTAGSQALHSVRHVRGQVKNGLQHASKVVEQVLSPLNVKVHGTLARISQPSLVRAVVVCCPFEARCREVRHSSTARKWPSRASVSTSIFMLQVSRGILEWSAHLGCVGSVREQPGHRRASHPRQLQLPPTLRSPNSFHTYKLSQHSISLRFTAMCPL